MMRRLVGALVLALMAGCSQPLEPSPRSSSAGQASHINPANIKKVAGALPAGDEVAGVTGVSSPAALWGLTGRWMADPPQCAVLADPLGAHGGPGHGVSGSGPGGISYAVVAASTTGPVALDPVRVAGCRHWTMTQGRTTARVRLVDAPPIDGVGTLGMASEVRTFVEGGAEIDSGTHTFVAYLGEYYAFTALVADPGAPHPALDPRFVADLLVKSVSALRS